MRRISLWTMSTITILVLLFSYRTSTSSTAAPVVAAGGLGRDTAPAVAGSSPEPSSSASPSTSSGSSSQSTSTTYTGSAVDTRYGPVQVRITVVDGKITASDVTQVPMNDRRDQEINGYAVPVLDQEAVQAQSASIDMVSGATFTSEGYIESLQSAIDQAHL